MGSWVCGTQLERVWACVTEFEDYGGWVGVLSEVTKFVDYQDGIMHLDIHYSGFLCLWVVWKEIGV